ncbi:MAG: uracil-DNA glycosylase [Pseudomonadota bacterium]
MNTVEGYVAPPTDLKNGDAGRQRKLTAAALLDWYASMGCTDVVADFGTDWPAKQNQPPGLEIREALANRQSDRSEPPAGGTQTLLNPSSRTIAGAATTAQSSTVPKPPPKAPPATTPSRSSSRSAPTDATIAAARAAAAAAPDLAALTKTIADFDGCGLKRTAKNVCVYRGAQASRIVVIGEAPGRDEDLQGKPFVGRAGQLLDQMLKAIGLTEDNTHITNVVYWRPPGNRAPTPQEAQTCRPFLEKQLELVDPNVVILMGGSAAKQLFETSDGIMRTRGKWKKVEIGGRQRDAIATLHPAYLLRTPSAKHMAWKDLQAVKKKLSE